MFGKNEIVGLKYFKDRAADVMFVTSMFMTLQGEGPFRGEPAFFIRLAKCNLACSFCDTFFDDGDWMTFDEIEQAIDKTINDYFDGEVPAYAQYTNSEDAQHRRQMVLVMTGGEPMLHTNIGAFLSRMEQVFAHTQIESNGTLVQDIPNSTVLVVSPKCAEKNGVVLKYLVPKEEMLARASCLKFVMSADPTSPYSSIPDWAHEWQVATGKPVYISPMNMYNTHPQRSTQLRSEKNSISIQERSTVDEVISFWEPGLLNMQENQLNHEYTARFCVQHGYTLNLQLQLYASLA
jgi:organic radical activating enzyme